MWGGSSVDSHDLYMYDRAKLREHGTRVVRTVWCVRVRTRENQSSAQTHADALELRTRQWPAIVDRLARVYVIVAIAAYTIVASLR